MQAIRSPKVLFIILLIAGFALYSISVGNSNTTNVVIKSANLDFQPDRIMVKVDVQNNSSKSRLFSDFTLHCTDDAGRDVAFRVLNNDGDPAIAARDSGPIKLDADDHRTLDLIGEKNEFYHSPKQCQKIAVAWKIDHDKSYYGQSMALTP